MQTLVSFHDPKLLERTLQYALTSARSQDSSFVIGRVIRSQEGEQPGWRFVTNRWNDMNNENGAFGGRSAGAIVASTSTFCSLEMRDQVQSFFLAHPVPGATRTLKQSLEEIGYCSDMKSRQGSQLASWLRNAGGHAGE